jgi:hypothetical protein
MKRRQFGLLTSTSLLAFKMGRANAQTTANASLLQTILTPMGAERASNADGSIPAWTGGYTTIPDGWKVGEYMPSPFDNEQPLLVITAANMAQYSDKLSEGVMVMMREYGFSIKVYPTHRTAAAPQEIYDNIALNVSRAQLNTAGGRFGFTNAFGGIPFPIPDVSDPSVAGVQIIWNHNSRWCGYGNANIASGYAVSNGLVALSIEGGGKTDYPYYKKGGSLATYTGLQQRIYANYNAPANDVGQELISLSFTNPYENPDESWELLNGQGRVRKAPEVGYDTPAGQADGNANYDEYYGFNSSPDRYDWTFIGKKEMYIPYHNNSMLALSAVPAHLAHFLDPNVVRFELHRVWVVEAKLHPGARNVMARRRFYIDEDTWTIGANDTYDGNDNIFHTGLIPTAVFSDS